MEEYKELKKQEKQLVGIMNGIARFVNEFQKGKHEIQIDVRLETLEEAMKKFYSVRRKIELYFDDEDSASEVKIAENTRSEREKRKKSFEAQAIFVCLVVKAVHLELVMDLTTQAFLAALKRFAARRGKPHLIMCDNATTFVGAKRELTELHRLFHDQKFQEILIKDTSSDGIEFRFIPPRTPNFGGLWEAQVKSFKGHFKKAVGTKVLKVDEMLTALAQIEAVLNSRPLTPISSDPSDFEALTPGHFLVQRPLTAIPEPDLQDLPTNRLSKWETAQQVSQQVWSRWSTQYLSDLHNRTKWTKQRNNIQVGTMVLLKDENAPPLKWHLGRVVKVFEGSDGNIRVVTVRTKDGCFDRGISKVCPLPIRDNDENNPVSNHVSNA